MSVRITGWIADSNQGLSNQSTCRFMLDLTRVTGFPGAATSAPDMNEFLN